MLSIAWQRAADLGRDVGLQEGNAEHLPFGDASFDTVACALSLCTIPNPAAAISEMKRVLVPGGRLLPLDHIGSTWPPVYAAQWLLERITTRTAGEHFTRRQLPLVQAAGFQVTETERLMAGTVERIQAVKPAWPAADFASAASAAEPDVTASRSRRISMVRMLRAKYPASV